MSDTGAEQLREQVALGEGAGVREQAALGDGGMGVREQVALGEGAGVREQVALGDGGTGLREQVALGDGGTGLREQVALGDGVVLQLVRPARLAEVAPPEISLSGAPGMEWVAQRAWRAEGSELQLACARGPAGAWVSGMDALLLDGASALARKASGAPSLQAQGVVRQDGRYAQAFTLGDDGQQGQGRHLLGFADQGDAVVVCTLLCRAKPERCEGSLATMQLAGQLAAEPTDTVPARSIALLAAHPSAALALLVVALLLLTGWVLARRPRPRRR